MKNLCFVFALLLMLSPIASAHTEYLSAAELVYPNIVDTSLDSCSLCHSTGFNRNSYGSDYGLFGHNFQSIENEDSDADGFLNGTEIDALTFPGNPNSFPIIMGTLKLKKPNGGETWTIGTKALVSWTSTGDVGTDVSIELWQNGQKARTLKGTTPNDGKQKVALKNTLPTGTGFTIKVISISDPSIEDESDSTFSIVAGP
jgi:hypothetical protein